MKPGRKPSEIDKAEFIDLLQFYPTREQVAEWFGVCGKTIDRWVHANFDTDFTSLREQKFEKTKLVLFRKQMAVALEGNVTMLIWLGKQHLNQSDKMESKNDLTSGGKAIGADYSKLTPETKAAVLKELGGPV